MTPEEFDRFTTELRQVVFHGDGVVPPGVFADLAAWQAMIHGIVANTPSLAQAPMAAPGHALAPFLSVRYPRPRWLVEGVVHASQNGWIFGEPKTRKTLLMLDLYLAIGSGTPWLSQFPVGPPQPCCFIEEEDPPWLIQARLESLDDGRLARMHPGCWIFVRDGLQLDHRASLEGVRTWCRDTPHPAALFWDVFSKLHLQDEGDWATIMPCLHWLDRLRDEFGVANLLGHHTRKPNTIGPDRASPLMKLRGPGQMAGWAEQALAITRPRKDPRAIIVAVDGKSDRLAEPFLIGFEPWGDPALGQTRPVYRAAAGQPSAAHTKARGLVESAFEMAPGHPVTVADLVRRTELSDKSVKTHLLALIRERKVEKAGATLDSSHAALYRWIGEPAPPEAEPPWVFE
jgi:AAA domain